jgi:transcription elongation GreA/GreB family factor
MSDTDTVSIRERLLHLATSAALDELENTWLEAIERDEVEVGTFLEAAEILNRIGERERAIVLLTMLHDEIASKGSDADALRILRKIADSRPGDPDVRRKTVECVRRVHRELPALSALLEKSGLEGGKRIPDALAVFEEFTRFRPDRHVYHATGWGTGQVRAVDPRTGELTVDFEEDKGHRLPIDSAREIFELLDDEDLRSYKFSRLDEIRALAVEDPARVIRLVLRGRGGKAGSTEIRNDLRGAVVAHDSWSRWWTKARKEAARDPYIEVQEGTKPVYVLRDRPVDVGEEALATVRAAGSLDEAVSQARSFLRNARESMDLGSLVEALLERLRDPSAAVAEHGAGAVLEALLFLEDVRGAKGEDRGLPSPDELLREQMREALPEGESDPGRTAEAAGEILAGIRIQEYRNRFPDVLCRVLEEHWVDVYPDLLRGEGHDIWDIGITQLRKAGRDDIVRRMFTEMMEEPERHPLAFLAFARGLLHERYAGVPGLPDRVAVVLRLLHVCEKVQKRTSTLDPTTTKKILTRIEALLLDPKHHHLATALKSVSLEEMERIFHEVEASPYLSDDLKSAVQTTVARNHPELMRRRQKPFWEDGFLYSTSESIRRKQEEFRHLTEVKIPENSRAVGAAAALGDLSENSEYTAALEAQRLLTQKAEELRASLDRARVLEVQPVPDAVAAPGTLVHLRSHESGESVDYRLLGPWDAGADDRTISYLSPLGKSLLGKKAGEEVRAELPGGIEYFTLVSIDKLY